MNRINPQPEGQSFAQHLAKTVMEAKLAGDLNTPKESLDRAFMLVKTLKEAITVAIASVEKGLLGEPTTEDLQRCHELKALLEDLP